MAKIDDVISYLDTQITKLSALNYINVVKRIDEVVDILKDARDIAVGTQESQKFDLAVSAPNCTVTFSVDGQTVTAGSNVLTYGDELTITCTANTGYDVTSLKVNNVNFVSGSTITVTDNLNVVATTALKTFNLTQTVGENCSLACTIDGESVSAGTSVLTYGDELTITATASEGYEISTLTVNGDAFTSGNDLTVTGNVAIVLEATAIPAPETTPTE